MKRIVRIGAVILAAMLLTPLTACRWAEQVTVQIPDFDSSAVDGVWIWRENDFGDYERSIEIRLGNVILDEGLEIVNYSVVDADGDVRLRLPTEVVRDNQNPDSVELKFLLMLLDGDGLFRATTYNSVGESALSAEILDIQAI